MNLPQNLLHLSKRNHPRQEYEETEEYHYPYNRLPSLRGHRLEDPKDFPINTGAHGFTKSSCAKTFLQENERSAQPPNDGLEHSNARHRDSKTDLCPAVSVC